MLQPQADHYDVYQAAEVSGLTRYMIDYLDRAHIVRPSVRRAPGRGRRRLYAFGDLVALRTVAALLSGGVEAKKLKKSFANLQRWYGKDAQTIPKRFLVSDGRTIYYRDALSRVVDLTSGGQLVFGFVVDLAWLHRDTVRALRAAAA